MKKQTIEKIRQQFHKEWLLIAVDEVDQSTGTPIRGTLLGHSQSVEVLWEEAENHTEPVMVLFSDDWPDDVAACFTNCQ